MTPTAAVVTRPLGTGVARPPAVPATRLLAAVLAVAFLLLRSVPGAPAAADPAVTVPAPAASGPLTLELSGLAPRVVTRRRPRDRHRHRHAAQHRRPPGRRPRDPAAARRGAAHRRRRARRAGRRRPRRRRHPRVHPAARHPRAGRLAARHARPSRCAATRPRASRSTGPGCTSCSSTSTGCRATGCAPGWPPRACCCRCCRCRQARTRATSRSSPRCRAVAAGLTVLYPLVDTPHRLPTVPGEQTLLADDDLARSLAPDGRLGGLLAAFAEGAPAGSAVRAATCLAVDPDLVATAAAMRQGYAVRGPNGTVPGTGAEVAGTWLDTLAAAARGGCVVALPFADADLVALARGQLGDLGRLAVADAGAVVTEALGTPVLDATTWPSGGVLDEPALAGVADAGARAVVLDAATVDGGRGGRPVRCRSPSGRRRCSPCSPTPCSPARRTPRRHRHPRSAGTATTVSAHATSPPLATQDAAAALVFRAQAAKQPAGGGADRPRSAARVAHGRDGRRSAARRREPAARHRPGAGARPRRRRRRRADDSRRGPAPRGPAAGRQPRHPAHGARVRPRDACGRARPAAPPPCPRRGSAPPSTRPSSRCCRPSLRPASATWHGRPDLAALGGHGGGNPDRGAARLDPRPRPAQPVLAGDHRRAAAADGRERAPGDDGGAPEHLQHHRPAGRADPAAADPAAGPAAGAGQRGGRAVGAVLGGGDRAQPGGPGARPAEPPAGALHRLRHDHGVVDGIRGRAARRAGGAPGGAPDAGRAEPARPDRALGRPPDTRGPDARDRRHPRPAATRNRRRRHRRS